jgi:osmoprotectant transport system permease protein
MPCLSALRNSRPTGSRVHVLYVIAGLVLCSLAANAAPAAEQPLRIGSKRFTESYILGEVVRLTAEQAGTAAVHERGLGNTGIVFNALTSGAIDAYPDYTGTIAREILKLERVPPIAQLNAQLAALGLAAGVPLGFNNTYALAMRGDEAKRLHIASLADLAAHTDLRLGLSQEFIGRKDGWAGLKQAYALPFATPRGLDHGLAFEALAAGQVDVIDVYATDAKIGRYDLVVLTDDRSYFPRYDAVLVYRADLPRRFPRAWQAMARLEGRIDEAAMIRLNGEAELQGRDFADIAREFLAQAMQGALPSPATEARALSFPERLFGEDFWRLLREHLLLTFISLAASCAVGVPLGIIAARRAKAGAAIIGAAGVIQTIPSLALLAFLIPVFNRIGALPAFVALALYALLPIVRNTATGLTQIPPGLKQAGAALGLMPREVLRHVELPLAAPTILAGIRTSAVINVGTATIAAFIGAGGFGERIATGLALNDHATLLAGAIPAAALALAVEGAFALSERWFTPAGLRVGARGNALV